MHFSARRRGLLAPTLADSFTAFGVPALLAVRGERAAQAWYHMRVMNRICTSEREPDGADWARKELGRNLRTARIMAGLSQAQLASKLQKSETMVSRIEAGEVSAGERYVLALLKACGLPKDWVPP